jgi:hypothetical protein
MKKPKKHGKKPAADTLTDALGKAGWAEADRALIAALAEAPALDAAMAQLGVARTAAAVRQARDSWTMLAQGLAATARRRGIESFGEIGASDSYDPKRHLIDAPVARAPAKVRVLAPGFARGDTVLAKARVAPVRPRKAAPKTQAKSRR